MKQQVERMHRTLSQLQVLKPVGSRNPHTLLRGWNIWFSKPGRGHYSHWRLMIEEVPKPVGDRLDYMVEDISSDLRFQWQIRVESELIGRFKKKFNIVCVDFEPDGVKLPVLMRLWSLPHSNPHSVAIDLYNDLVKLKIGKKDGDERPDSVRVAKQVERLQKRKSRLSTRCRSIIQIMYEMFDERGMSPIEAMEFAFLEQTYSHPTVMKAKTILGIESIRTKGKWYWLPPQEVPDVAIKKAHETRINTIIDKIRDYKKLNSSRFPDRPSVRALRNLMESHNYNVRKEEVKKILGDYARITVYKAKQALGVVSVKDSSGWRWLYPAPVIQEWMMNQIESGPKPLDEIIKDAKEMGWGELLIKAVRRRLLIRFCVIDGITCLRRD